MFGKSYKLFKMFGFEVKIDLSWLIILVLVVWSLAGAVFPEEYKGYTRQVYFVMGLVGAFGLFFSIVFHELCHSLVARRYGLPMKGITLFLFGGVAEMSDEPPNPKAEFMMAAAGPLSSIVLAVALSAVSLVGGRLGWAPVVSGMFKWLGILNGYLAAFNLIPGFPLDGGRVLRSILWHTRHNLRSATQTASRVGLVFGGLLIALGFLYLLLLRSLGGMWWILIGMFLRGAARQGYQSVLIRQALSGEKVRRFMSSDPMAVPGSLPLRQLVDDYIYRYHFKMFPVLEGDRLSGCISTREVRDVPQDQWQTRTVGEVVRPCSMENTISADEDTMKALVRMNSTGTSRLMVVDDGRLVGILSLKDLLRFLALKMELEGEDASKAARSRSVLEQ